MLRLRKNWYYFMYRTCFICDSSCSSVRSSWILSLQAITLFRVMNILSRRNLRKQLTATREALPYHQQQWPMQIGQWPISKSRGKFDKATFLYLRNTHGHRIFAQVKIFLHFRNFMSAHFLIIRNLYGIYLFICIAIAIRPCGT